LKDLWKSNNFLELEYRVPSFKGRVEGIALNFNNLNYSVFSRVLDYNLLIQNLTNSIKNLLSYSGYNLTNYSCGDLNKTIFNFNGAVNNFNEERTISAKKEIVNEIVLEIKSLYLGSEDNSSNCLLSEISKENLTEIKIISINRSVNPISLEEPISICCFYGNCSKCCEDECSGENYPVIFLHGHSVNRALAADYSLDTFEKIKKKLSGESYIDAGSIVISDIDIEKGLWGRVRAPIEVTASYYFDAYKTDTGEIITPSKSDSIDTYAIRLKDIIEIVKHRTNKEKVIVVAHSMGGLVTRRYVDIFGENDVAKVILIDTPNHGIEDQVKNYCGIIGPKVACNEMDKNSLLINKLSSSQITEFPVYNIIGIGCNMGDETGDGIVKNSSQYLSYAKNYYLYGTCDELKFDFLHENIVDPDKYTEVYELIKGFLKE